MAAVKISSVVSTLLCLITYCLARSEVPKSSTLDESPSPLQKLRKDLLNGYDKYARPVVHHMNTTSVTFGILPRYLSDLDEEKQVLTLETWLRFNWNDDHLQWKPEDYSGLTIIHFAVHETWQPDISVYSSMPVSHIDPRMDSHILSYPSGEQLWVPPATIHSYCEMNYANYPYDTQECNIIFGSWTHHGYSIDLKLYQEAVDLSEFHNTNPRWDLFNATVERKVKYYSCCSEPYVTVNATFFFQRKQPSLPQHALWGPSLVAILFTLAMFWLPSNSVQKVILGCTSLTILTVLLLYVGETVHSPTIAIITANDVHSLMYIVGSATLMEIIILNLARIAGPLRPPSIITDLLYGIVGRVLLICPTKRRFGLIDKIEESNIEDGEEPLPRDAADDWLVASTALDRICFLIYLLIFIIHKNI